MQTLLNYLSRRHRAAILAAQDLRASRHAPRSWWRWHLDHHRAFRRWLTVLAMGDRARAARWSKGV